MKIERLCLKRYGRFTDLELDLSRSAAAHDLHLVVGPNEIGKSTLRQAIGDLLYGMPRRSAMGFVHALSELEVSACLSSAHSRLSITRLKKDKNDLRDPQGGILAQEALLPFIGQSDRDLFERMFCFDRDQLQQNASQMLDQHSDAGQVLFESAAGIQGLSRYQRQLETSAEAVYAPKKKLGRAFYDALDAYKRAAGKTRELSQDAATFRKARKDAAETAAVLSEVIARLTQKRARYAMLKRVRAAAPILRNLRLMESELEDNREASNFPEDASTQFAEAINGIASIQPALEREREFLRDREMQQKALPVQTPLLDAEDAIEAFGREVAAASSHARELEEQRGLIQQALRRIAGACPRVGWTFSTADDPSVLLGRIAAVKALKVPAQDIASLRERQDQQHQLKAELDEERAQMRDAVASIPSMPAPELVEALKEARQVLVAEADRRQAVAQHQQHMSQAEQIRACLQPWGGDLTALAALNVLDEAAATEARAQKSRLQIRLESAVTERQRLEDEQDELKGQIEAICEQAEVVTDDELDEIRTSRNAMLEKALARPEDQGARTRTRALVADADLKADTRYHNAKAVHAFEDAQRKMKLLQRKLEKATTRIDALRAELHALDQRWAASMHDLGLEGLSAEQYGGWLNRRRQALDAVAKAEEYRVAVERHEQARQAARLALLSAANRQGIALDTEAHLSALVEALSAIVDQANEAQARYQHARAALEKTERRAAEIEHVLEQTAAALKQAEARWAEGLKRAAMDITLEPEMIESIVDTVVGIDAQIADIQRRQSERVEVMQAALNRVGLEQDELRRRFELFDAPADAAGFVTVLRRKLQEERRSNERRKQLDEELRKSEAIIVRQERELAMHRDVLARLHQIAGTTSEDALRRALQAAGERAGKLAQRAQLLHDLEAIADGRTREDIELELEAVDFDQVQQELMLLESEMPQLENEKEQALANQLEAERVLKQMAGSGAAAVAEAQRVSAAGEVQEAIDQYLQLKTRARLLAWGIDWFRRERQGPVLQAASEMFSQLTQGSFQRLSVDVSETTPKLTAVRTSFPNVGIQGMSEGTRDQLYLALRLAAVQQHVEKATPLPFIADDLFMSFDDSRTEAAFASLARLAERTQVLYFTHHQHLVDVARRVVPDIHVHQLG